MRSYSLIDIGAYNQATRADKQLEFLQAVEASILDRKSAPIILQVCEAALGTEISINQMDIRVIPLRILRTIFQRWPKLATPRYAGIITQITLAPQSSYELSMAMHTARQEAIDTLEVIIEKRSDLAKTSFQAIEFATQDDNDRVREAAFYALNIIISKSPEFSEKIFDIAKREIDNPESTIKDLALNTLTHSASATSNLSKVGINIARELALQPETNTYNAPVSKAAFDFIGAMAIKHPDIITSEITNDLQDLAEKSERTDIRWLAIQTLRLIIDNRPALASAELLGMAGKHAASDPAWFVREDALLLMRSIVRADTNLTDESFVRNAAHTSINDRIRKNRDIARILLEQTLQQNNDAATEVLQTVISATIGELTSKKPEENLGLFSIEASVRETFLTSKKKLDLPHLLYRSLFTVLKNHPYLIDEKLSAHLANSLFSAPQETSAKGIIKCLGLIISKSPESAEALLNTARITSAATSSTARSTAQTLITAVIAKHPSLADERLVSEIVSASTNDPDSDVRHTASKTLQQISLSTPQLTKVVIGALDVVAHDRINSNFFTRDIAKQQIELLRTPITLEDAFPLGTDPNRPLQEIIDHLRKKKQLPILMSSDRITPASEVVGNTWISRPENATKDVPIDRTAVTKFFEDKLTLHQFSDGLRSINDAVLLAASVEAQPGNKILELGCGTGAAMLSLAYRISGIAITGLEKQPEVANLASRNAVLNGFGNNISIVVSDLRQAKLMPESFDQIIANPPFVELESANQSSDSTASSTNSNILRDWVDCAFSMLRPKGSATFIYPADRMDALLTELAHKTKDITVFPLWPMAERPAKRVLIRAQKNDNTSLRILPGLILYTPKGNLTAKAKAIMLKGSHLAFK